MVGSRIIRQVQGMVLGVRGDKEFELGEVLGVGQ